MKDFYTSPKWRMLRSKALSLYGDECMNCGLAPQETGRSAHVDHIKPRSLFSHLELKLSNLQILCEDCNCAMKGIHVVDYRTSDHMKVLERYENGRHVLKEYQRVVTKDTKQEDVYKCRRELSALKGLGPKKLKYRLAHITRRYNERVVSQALNCDGFRS